MKKTTAGYMRRLIALSYIILSFSLLIGCGIDFKLPKFSEMPVENGFIYLEQNGGITLMGIKAEAVDEDGAVVIPKTINGKTVKRIGYTQKNFIYAESQGGFSWGENDNIKEVYIPSTVTEIDDIFFLHKTNYYINFNKNFESNITNAYRYGSGVTSTYTYPIDLFVAYRDNEALGTFLDYYGYNTFGRRIANVYYNSNPNEDFEFCYWFDYIEGESKLRKPKVDPTRDGYKFTGWYTEPECINLWDFESTVKLTKMEPEDDYNDQGAYFMYLTNLENSTIALFAGWKQL